MLAKAGVGVLGIERIDQQRVAPLDESARLGGIENGRMAISGGIQRFGMAQRKGSLDAIMNVLYITKYFMSTLIG